MPDRLESESYSAPEKEERALVTQCKYDKNLVFVTGFYGRFLLTKVNRFLPNWFSIIFIFFLAFQGPGTMSRAFASPWYQISCAKRMFWMDMWCELLHFSLLLKGLESCDALFEDLEINPVWGSGDLGRVLEGISRAWEGLKAFSSLKFWIGPGSRDQVRC